VVDRHHAVLEAAERRGLRERREAALDRGEHRVARRLVPEEARARAEPGIAVHHRVGDAAAAPRHRDRAVAVRVHRARAAHVAGARHHHEIRRADRAVHEALIGVVSDRDAIGPARRELHEARHDRGIAAGLGHDRDLHVVAGSWNLLFALLLAFTGTYLSLFVPLGQPVFAHVGYSGDQAPLFQRFESAPVEPDATWAPMGDIDALLADARRRAGTSPQRLDIQHWGRRDATVTISMAQRDRALRAPMYIYAGATGAFLAEKPGLGKAPSAGGTASDLIGPLHFGNFAGTASKAVWFALGFCCAYVTLTGMLLWTQRRQEIPVWRRLGLATTWVGYGLPSALVSVAVAYFLARAAGGVEYYWMLSAFLGAIGLAGLVTLLARDPRRLLLGAAGVMLVALPLVRWLSGGPSWLALLHSDLTMVIATDVALVIGGAFALRSARCA